MPKREGPTTRQTAGEKRTRTSTRSTNPIIISMATMMRSMRNKTGVNSTSRRGHQQTQTSRIPTEKAMQLTKLNLVPNPNNHIISIEPRRLVVKARTKRATNRFKRKLPIAQTEHKGRKRTKTPQKKSKPACQVRFTVEFS